MSRSSTIERHVATGLSALKKGRRNLRRSEAEALGYKTKYVTDENVVFLGYVAWFGDEQRKLFYVEHKRLRDCLGVITADAKVRFASEIEKTQPMATREIS
jgi:hypothetical protein